ncbi:MraY family glycosyltransferase [Candidatus Omnitrophota bacterium]
MSDFPVVLLFSFLLALLFSILLRALSLKLKIFQSKNGTPYVGGIACALTFSLSYFYYLYIHTITLPLELAWLLVFSLIVLVVELFDDLKDFSLRPRLVIQFLLVALFLVYGKRTQIYFLPVWLNYFISFLWMLGIMQAFNHLDIADGLCGGVAAIISLSFLWISFICGKPLLVVLFLVLSSSLLIFISFNLPSARIYLGNSGSHFLGFLLAGLCMYGDYATVSNVIRLSIPEIGLLVPLCILAFPLFDTLFLIFIRLKKGIVPVKKSDDHIFLLFLRSGYEIKTALAIVYGLTAAWCLAGLAIVLNRNFAAAVSTLIALVLTVFVVLRSLSGNKGNKKTVLS